MIIMNAIVNKGDIVFLEFTEKSIMVDHIKGLSVVNEHGTNGTSFVKNFHPLMQNCN